MIKHRITLLVSLFIVFSIIIPIYSFFPKVNIDDRDNAFTLKSADEWSSIIFLEYNEYCAVWAYSSDCINWDIDRSSLKIDIIVLVMDSLKYANFKSDVISDGLISTVNGGYYEILSDGTQAEVSGNYHVPHSETWYIIFVNLDNLYEITLLDFEVEWDPREYSFFRNFSAFPLIFIGVFSTILFFIVCGIASSSSHKKKSVITRNNNLMYINQKNRQLKYLTQCQ